MSTANRIAAVMAEWRDAGDDLPEELKLIRELAAERDALADYKKRASWFIDSKGYQRCNIAACNCPYWHGGQAEERLTEAHVILQDAGYNPLRKTLRASLYDLVAERDELREALSYVLEQTVDQDLKYGITLTEGEEDARNKALALLAKGAV